MFGAFKSCTNRLINGLTNTLQLTRRAAWFGRPVAALQNVASLHSCCGTVTTSTCGVSFTKNTFQLTSVATLLAQPRRPITINQLHRRGPRPIRPRKRTNKVLEGAPQIRGVIIKTIIKKPKKPNSANRRCVKVRLSNGRIAVAYVPGEGHNLQEHNQVLLEGAGGRAKDLVGVKLCVVRGTLDCPHLGVKKKRK